MLAAFEVLIFFFWVISVPVFLAINLITEFKSRLELNVLRGILKSMPVTEAKVNLDFLEYSKTDRGLFGLCVIEFGMIIVLVIYV